MVDEQGNAANASNQAIVRLLIKKFSDYKGLQIATMFYSAFSLCGPFIWRLSCGTDVHSRAAVVLNIATWGLLNVLQNTSLLLVLSGGALWLLRKRKKLNDRTAELSLLTAFAINFTIMTCMKNEFSLQALLVNSGVLSLILCVLPGYFKLSLKKGAPISKDRYIDKLWIFSNVAYAVCFFICELAFDWHKISGNSITNLLAIIMGYLFYSVLWNIPHFGFSALSRLLLECFHPYFDTAKMKVVAWLVYLLPSATIYFTNVLMFKESALYTINENSLANERLFLIFFFVTYTTVAIFLHKKFK